MAFTQINDIRLFSRWHETPANSDEITLVPVAGGPGLSHTIFRPALDPVANTCSILYFDPRGTGQSDLGQTADWTLEQFADDLVQLLISYDIKNALLYGHSAGAHISALAANKCPERVKGLILASGVFLNKQRMFKNWVELGGELAQQAIVNRNPASLGPFLAEIGPKYDPIRRPPEHGTRLQFNADLCLYCLHDFLDVDLAELVQQTDCPIALFMGKQDPICTYTPTFEIVSAMNRPTITTTTFQLSGHDILLCEPKLHNRTVADFCRRAYQYL